MRYPRKWPRFLLALFAGFALAFGQAPFNFPWLAIVALPGLYWLFMGTSCWKGGFSVGWAAGLGYFGLSLSWIVEPFLVDISRHGWMAPFALILMAGGLALFWGLGFALASRWKSVLVWAGFWTLTEVVRSYIFTGFPWGLMAYNWIETPAIQAVSLIGVHGFGFLVVLCGGLLLSRHGAIAALLIAIILTVFGLWRLEIPIAETGLTVRLIQPNATQTKKWDPTYTPVFYQRQLEMSAAAGAPDIVIWPEVSTVFLPDEQPLVRSQIVSAAQAPVIIGARRRDAGDVFNSLFLLNQFSEIDGVYDKFHLVPFGEYMPLQNLARQWGLQGLAEAMGGSIAFGEGAKLLEGDGIPPFLPLICYEAIFPQGIAGPRPEWLVQITNDAWFGAFNGPYQHLAQARMRAIEHGLPMARAANTGVSAMIDPLGRITKSLPLGVEGYLDVTLPAPLPPTVLAQTGQWPMIALLIILLATGIWRKTGRRR